MLRWTLLIEKYRTTTNIVGTVLVAWILSLLIGQAIGFFLARGNPLPPMALPPPDVLHDDFSDLGPGGARLQSYMPICERNIFDSQKRTVCTEEVASQGEAGEQTLDLNSPPVKSDLGASLLGTMVFSNSKRSFATIQARGAQGAEPFYIDQMLMGEAKIYDIQRNKVFFIRNGHREFLEVENLPNIYAGTASNFSAPPPVSSGVRLEGNKAILSRAKVDSTLGDLNQVIQQARMVPNFKGDAVDGFKIFAIRPGSIFEELGLKNGDVIQRINGSEINSVEKAIPMLQLARNESSITIDLLRNGTKQTLTLDIR